MALAYFMSLIHLASFSGCEVNEMNDKCVSSYQAEWRGVGRGSLTKGSVESTFALESAAMVVLD